MNTTYSVQDQALQLVFSKGMSEAEAIAEIEQTHQLSPLTIASIRDTIDIWRYHHLVKPRDVTELCYFCGKKVGEAQFCYGCQNWICNGCDGEQPTGKHQVGDHITIPTRVSQIFKEVK